MNLTSTTDLILVTATSQSIQDLQLLFSFITHNPRSYKFQNYSYRRYRFLPGTIKDISSPVFLSSTEFLVEKMPTTEFSKIYHNYLLNNCQVNPFQYRSHSVFNFHYYFDSGDEFFQQRYFSKLQTFTFNQEQGMKLLSEKNPSLIELEKDELKASTLKKQEIDSTNVFTFESQTNCSICLEKFSYDEKLIKTKCKHVFHESCLRSWLLVKKEFGHTIRDATNFLIDVQFLKLIVSRKLLDYQHHYRDLTLIKNLISSIENLLNALQEFKFDAYNKVKKTTAILEQSKTTGEKLDEGFSATKDKTDHATEKTKVPTATEGKPVKVKENLKGAKDYVAKKAINVKDYSKNSANIKNIESLLS
ncbi:hypothetical protein HK099_006084 [Clydaea vesicula]|uniref:RING-type domain-containing protein n=1 Tax=Clydaea vesicula TaxID=447962 RepID=A0AAD5XUI4_9FUNG|nr:hypothetical protein HK099_006084 [Clydaea vesicula]